MITRPMLAAKATEQELKSLKYPVLASPKIDGVRALVIGGRVYSRSMKLIPNEHVQHLFGRMDLNGLDGELVVGLPTDFNLMQQTTSGVMSKIGKPNVTYYVFDQVLDESIIYYLRLKLALTTVKMIGQARVVFLEHKFVNSYEQLSQLNDEYLQAGYEGTMIRSLSGPYKQGRSTVKEGYLLKMKLFTDGEAEILALNEKETNTNEAKLDERGYTKRSSCKDGKVGADTLGSFTVRDLNSGVVFNLGSGPGFTDKTRQEFWKEGDKMIGKLVKYKSQHVGIKDKPRIPLFIGIRSPLDM